MVDRLVDQRPPRRDFGAAWLTTLNAALEPAIRAGLGSPCLVAPAGLIVLEVRGRKTGLTRRIPLFAMLAGSHVVAGTVRVDRSQWLRNVSQSPDVRYWLGGRPHEARAHVVMPGADALDAGDDGLDWLLGALRAPAAAFGAAFVVLARESTKALP